MPITPVPSPGTGPTTKLNPETKDSVPTPKLMIPSFAKDLIKRRGTIKGRLTKFKDYITNLQLETTLSKIQISELSKRLEKMQELFSTFDDLQTQIENQSDDVEDQLNDRDAIEKQFFSLLSIGDSIVESFHKKQVANDDDGSVNSGQSSKASIFNSIKLPTINLPSFDGNYLVWLEFRDTFDSLINSNDSIPNINKFHYLRSALLGSAKGVIKSIEFTSNNYTIAWDLLCERYNNKNILINNHLKALFNIDPISKESYKAIRYLIDVVSKNLRSLNTLGQPTDHWDTLIIYMVSGKLDSTTSRKWEEHKVTLNSIPSLNDFFTFLRSRADVLETAVSNRPNEVKNSNNNRFIQKDYKSTKTFTASLESQHGQYLCVICNDSHRVYECPKFKMMSTEDRNREVTRLKLCSNCLRAGHNSSQCRLRGGCRLCRKKHNTLVHSNSVSDSDSVQPTTSSNSLPISLAATSSEHVLLCTALVKIANEDNNLTCVARALLDTGSQSSFITESLKRKLKFPSDRIESLRVSGINNATCTISERCQLRLSSRVKNFSIPVQCLIVPTITGVLPNVPLDIRQLNLPTNIELADPNFHRPADIDILLGADIYWDIVGSKQIRLGKSKPTLQDSQLGWLVSGPSGTVQCMTNTYCSFSQQSRVHETLQKFWEIEELHSNQKSFSPEEQFCENSFIENTYRLPNGRFSVKIPLKESPEISLGDSFHSAKIRFLNLERKLNKNENLKLKYLQFVQEYANLGHLTEIDPPKFGFYLPHHCVLREKSETTKLRVVFDASLKTSTGKSLNDIQLVGPVVQSDLVSILLRFRIHRYVVTADIEKMYRQIAVDESQRHLQLILWRESETQPIRTLQLNTLTYGTASAPYLSTRCLLQLSEECTDASSARTIKNDFYVDDLITGSMSKSDLRVTIHNVTQVLDSACFPLRKFRTNCPQIFEKEGSSTDSLELCKESSVLGLNWNPKSDSLQFSANVQSVSKITKRTIISMTSQIFDPLGLLSPCILKAKVLLQHLWSLKLDWDDPVPQEFIKRWSNFIDNVSCLSQINIPRFVLCNEPEATELHCFVDASQEAYGACVYLRSVDKSGMVAVNLLCSKARVAPMKQMTIPRLELCGALLGSRLCLKVIQALNCVFTQKVVWTDSTVVLGWIKSNSKDLKAFVSNRVNEINEITGGFQWRHIPTEMNPADLASRGLEPQHLQASFMWWEGPPVLKKDQSEWPQGPSISIVNLPELKSENTKTNKNIYNNNNKISCFTIYNTQNIIIQFDKFSNLLRLKRTVAYVLRFKNNCNKNKTKLTGPLGSEELNESLILLVRISQCETFQSELECFNRGDQLHRKSKLLSLNPFLDSDGLIRVGGRIQNSDYDFNKKHPLLLDSKHKLTKLILKYEHLHSFHGGPQLILSLVRDKFWPIGGRNLARAICRQCITCARLQGKVVQPKMGNLPAERITPSFPFQSCGVDFAGPFMISSKKGRGNRVSKSYLCLFVCLATKALHLEIVSELSTEGFILSLRRFVSRRGKPDVIYCDNGTNFVGANNELGRIMRASRQSIIDFSSNEGIKFMFSPPYSPHFGGIWEAGVKSAKHHLKRIAGNASLTFEELATLFAQIEAILNSRPLSPLSSNPSDLTPLTPGHFLVGRPLMSVPSLPINTNRPNRYQKIEQIRQHFWERWRREFVAEMQQRTKWQCGQDSLNKDDLVILKDDNLPPLRWRLGRVCRLYPGHDGVESVKQNETDGSVAAASERPPDHCVVGGAHAFVLRISSFFGLAPLKFESYHNGFTITLSSAMCIYSYILVTVLVICTVYGLVAEINVGVELSVRMSSRMSQLVSTCDVLVVVATAGAGVYGAPRRMKKLLRFMESIASVDNSIGAQYSAMTERKLCVLLLAILLFFTVLLTDDFCFYAMQAKKIDRQWDVVSNYIAFYLLWYVVVILELQFAFTALSLRARFQAVNDAIALTARDVSLPIEKAKEQSHLNVFAIRVAPEPPRAAQVSLLLDPHPNKDSAVIIKKNAHGTPRLLVPPCEAVRRLASLHGALCEVVHRVDDSYGLPLVVVLISTLLHLIVTPYFLIMEIIVSTNRIHFLVLQFLWCATHMLRMFVVVEPCHYTIKEGKRTEGLVCRLMMAAPSTGVLPTRLELFSRQLMLQNVSYTPLGMCTLDRPLVASVIGAVTTYLVILIQFQRYDN